MNEQPMINSKKSVVTELNANDISLLIDALDGTLQLDDEDHSDDVCEMVSRLCCLFQQVYQ